MSPNSGFIDLTQEQDNDIVIEQMDDIKPPPTTSSSTILNQEHRDKRQKDTVDSSYTTSSSSTSTPSAVYSSSSSTTSDPNENSNDNVATSRSGRVVKSTNASKEFKESLEKKQRANTSRFGRKLKSTLVRIDGYDVLATNNYVVKGGEYVYDTTAYSKPKARKSITPKKKTEIKEKKPRIRSAAEEKRIERVNLLKTRITTINTNRDNFLSNHIPILSPFLEDKVLHHLNQVKAENKQNPPKSAEHSNIFMQPDDIVAEMRDYQLEGLDWMMQMHHKGLGMILGDEMGLGKTLQTISLICQLKQTMQRNGPSLVICPLSVLYSWCNELDKFAPSLKYVRMHSSCIKEREVLIMKLKEDVSMYDVIITTYEMVKTPTLKHFWSTQYFNYVVLDEGHIIKNRYTEISHAVRRLHYENVLILTGTPLQNNLEELWAILNYLSPTIFTTCDPFKEAFDLLRNVVKKDMLHAINKILSMFMLRRLKVEVEKLLPAKVETQVLCPLSKVQHSLYKSVLMKDIDLIINSEENESNTSYNKLRNIIMQLRKCCDHPFLFKGMEDDIENTSVMDLISSSGKLSVLDLLLRSLFQKNHRVVLFSQFTAMLDIIEDYCEMRGWKFCRFDGSTPRARRNLIVNDFNAPNSNKFLFLMSTRSGGMGLNLQTADTCILFDSDWNPQADVQAMARVHRIGQKKIVHVYRLVTGKTTEQRMVERAQQKLYLDKVVNVSSAVADEAETSGLTAKDIISDLKFGSDAIFGSSVHSLPTSQDIETITDRSRTENTSIGNLKGGFSINVSSFDADKVKLTETFKYEGVDFRKIRDDKTKEAMRRSCGLAYDDQWQTLGKRERSSRISMIASKGSGYGAPVPILKSNNYDLEAGESSVFDRELAGRSKPRENYAVSKKDKVIINHQKFCQVCGYFDGDLILCLRCPIAVHAHCVGLRKKDVNKMYQCSHHRCTVCNKNNSGAGGVLYPCQSCPNSYCEDCLPKDFKRFLYQCPRFEELEFDSEKRCCYIHCSSQCELVAMKDFGWRPEQKVIPVCPDALDLAGAFH